MRIKGTGFSDVLRGNLPRPGCAGAPAKSVVVAWHGGRCVAIALLSNLLHLHLTMPVSNNSSYRTPHGRNRTNHDSAPVTFDAAFRHVSLSPLRRSPRAGSSPQRTPQSASTASPANQSDSPQEDTAYTTPTVAMRDAAAFPTMNLVTAVRQQRQSTMKQNTRLAYDPKKVEWYDFCRLTCNDNIGTVTPEKCYKFLFYQAFRNKRTASKPHKLTLQEFNEIFSLYNERVANDQDIPDPENPICYSTLNTYRASVKEIWSEQVAEQRNSLTWDLIFQKHCLDLYKLIKGRQARVDKARYVEKIDAEFAPFTTIGYIDKIESELFQVGCGTHKEALPALRNRFIFLNCYSAILRHESLFLGELSDMVGLRHKRRADPAAMYIMVMQIATGKTVYAGNSKQYGRALRHKNVMKCSVGAFGFYLLYRFHVSGEMDDGNRPDFTDNRSWFDIKILASAKDNKVAIRKRTYTDAIAKAFKRLRILSRVIGHFGRRNGPLELELEEIPPDEINQLGQWDPNMQQRAYSAKIPTKTLRVMAGFEARDGYFVPRCNVEPCEELKRKIFPFIEEELQNISDCYDQGRGENPTAIATLNFWKDLRTIILQDAAAMIVGDGNRIRHHLFELPVFQTDLFKVR